MLKCILWGTGKLFHDNINLIKYYELKGDVEVIGVTSKDESLDNFITGYPWMSSKIILELDFDVIIVMTGREPYREICAELVEKGVDEAKVCACEILKLPEMDLEKYLKLKKNPPTIFTNFCWGGLTYHRLFLPFSSPFINIWINGNEYMKIIKDPKYYMEQPLQLIAYDWEPKQQIRYPICACGDAILKCVHSIDFESVNLEWERRKQRIDWDNLFVMMATEDRNLAEEFIKLPYERKVCFVPFRMNEESVMCIDVPSQLNNVYEYLNQVARGRSFYYDELELLKSGKLKRV